MKKAKRYDVSGLVEAQFEPGSRKQVLRNLLGIKSKREMDVAEAKALKRAVDELVRTYDKDHRFTAVDICNMHKTWLREIYAWAGKYRQINMSKSDIFFAAADQISSLMATFEQGPLRRHTPCNFTQRERLIQGLAEVHVELVLIHPFREGNGRLARVLATLMATQADLPLLNFEMIQGRKKLEYFKAVREGFNRNYRPMEEIFTWVIDRTFSTYPK